MEIGSTTVHKVGAVRAGHKQEEKHGEVGAMQCTVRELRYVNFHQGTATVLDSTAVHSVGAMMPSKRLVRGSTVAHKVGTVMTP